MMHMALQWSGGASGFWIPDMRTARLFRRKWRALAYIYTKTYIGARGRICTDGWRLHRVPGDGEDLSGDTVYDNSRQLTWAIREAAKKRPEEFIGIGEF